MMARIRKAMEKKDEGFTLVELLVVIIIIGILAAIAIPLYLNQQQKAKDAALKSDLKNAQIEAANSLVDNPTSTVDISGFTPSPGVTITLVDGDASDGNFEISGTVTGGTGATWSIDETGALTSS